MTPYTGGCTVTAAGTVIDAKTINCSSIIISAANVTIKRSMINGNSFSVVKPNAGGFVMSDVEITCNGAEGAYAINGGNGAVITRAKIHDCENGIEPGSNSTFQDSYVYNFRAIGAPHYDGVSIDGGQSNVLVKHNTIVLNQNQVGAVMTDNYFGSVTGVTVINNRLIGGGFTIYADAQFNQQTVQVKFIDNRIGGGYWGCCNIHPRANVSGSSGNVDDLTGQPINL